MIGSERLILIWTFWTALVAIISFAAGYHTRKIARKIEEKKDGTS